MSDLAQNEHLKYKPNKRRANPKFYCRTCGRHCRVLVNGNCSFCYDRAKANLQTEKALKKKNLKLKNYFTFCIQCGNRTTIACFERNSGLCGICAQTRRAKIKRMSEKNERKTTM